MERVAVPGLTPGRLDLFGAHAGVTDELNALTTELLGAGAQVRRPDKHGRPAFGAKLKRFIF